MPRTLDIQEKVEKLRSFLLKHNRLPGYNEMLKIFRYRSKNAVHGLLRKLEEQGFIRLEHGKIAFTERLKGGVRMLGVVQAGFPSPAEEELLDTMSLDEFLVEKPTETFMLKVAGDSMIEAGIQPGDMALVERGAAPKTNDIVVAQVDGEWTMKYFIKDRTGVRLEPANKKYKAIRPEQTLEIAGVVRSIVRKYGR